MSRIIKGDKVLITAGKDRNKTGKVIKVLSKNKTIIVEGVNIAKKHQRPQKQGQKGQIISLARPIDISNAMLLCPKCGKAVRTNYTITAGKSIKTKKIRICKKCHAEI